MKKILYIVLPCYNEEKILEITTKKFSTKLDKMILMNLIDSESKIMYVNDGSIDDIWNLIEELRKSNRFVIDLQDNVDVMEKFVLKYIEGYEIVYGVRNRYSV